MKTAPWGRETDLPLGGARSQLAHEVVETQTAGLGRCLETGNLSRRLDRPEAGQVVAKGTGVKIRFG